MANKKQRMTAAARRERLKVTVTSTGPKRANMGVFLSSPIKAVARPNSIRIRKVNKFYTNDIGIIKPQRTRKYPDQSREERLTQFRCGAKNLAWLQRRWAAVATFARISGSGRMTNPIADKIAIRYSIGSGRRLRQLVSTAEKTGDLTHQPGQGAKITVLEEVNKSMEAQAKEFGYAFTLEAMAEAVRAEMGKGSKRTIMRAMKRFLWKRRRQKIKPFLTLKHMDDRLNWAKRWISFKYTENNTVVVMIDEKWFYAFKEGRMLHLPDGVEPEHLFALSKTQVPKVSPLFCLNRLKLFQIIKFNEIGHVFWRRGCSSASPWFRWENWTVADCRHQGRQAEFEVPLSW